MEEKSVRLFENSDEKNNHTQDGWNTEAIHITKYTDYLMFFPLSMALPPFGPWPLFQFLNPIYSG
jgi:hypothetical protein